jgi:hypothetical protein
MRLLPVANAEAAAQLRKRPLVAVDMGLSGTTKSCGVALALPGKKPDAASYYFATAAETVSDFFRKHGDGVLILEAPLSAAFDAKRNPSARGDFEREGKPRWWNLRAGAQMALAALYFCRRLAELLPKNSVIHIIEGFVVGADSGEHADVAARLAGAFRGSVSAQWHEVATKGETASIAEWFGQPRGCACPVVLHPSAA